MKYRVNVKHGWDKFCFDFAESTTQRRSDMAALDFMKLVSETFVQEEKELKCWLEMIEDTPEEEDDGDISSED